MNKYGYAYFDSDGKLKEFIIDESVRQGNSGLNKIRIYWENPPVSFTTLGLTYINTDDLNPQWNVYPIPVNDGTTTDFYVEPVQDYDPIFFKYGKQYTGYEIALPDAILGLTGNIGLSLIAYDGSNYQVAYLGVITIYISETGFTFQRNIDNSQFYLLMNSVATKQWVNEQITHAELEPTITFDDEPTPDSNNVVKSGGIYDAIHGMIDLIYPIGSIYMSVNSTSPSLLFGGTWERIKDRFLLSAGDTYNAGDTGGEASHVLTSSEMPQHTHYMRVRQVNGQEGSAGPNGALQTNIAWSNWVSDDGGGYTNATGGSQSHNNMPPYLVVYVWKRVADE